MQLHEKYGAQGFEVLAFPCNQFAFQEPWSAARVQKWAAETFGASFMVMDKVRVNGWLAHPVFKFLKGACEACGGAVKWNFAGKFLVARDGTVVKRFGGDPLQRTALIEELLAASGGNAA